MNTTQLEPLTTTGPATNGIEEVPTELEKHLRDQLEANKRFDRFFWHRLRSRFAFSAFRRFLDPSSTVLDVGAGAGIFGQHFRQGFPEGRYAFVEPIPALSLQLNNRFGQSSNWNGKTYPLSKRDNCRVNPYNFPV